MTADLNLHAGEDEFFLSPPTMDSTAKTMMPLGANNNILNKTHQVRVRDIKQEISALATRAGNPDAPKTSMEIFMTHVRTMADGTTDASGIMSRECFDEWEASRKSKLKNPHLTFVHTVRSHVTGDPKTGRNPFPENVETSLLKLFRRRQIWPCFRGTRVKYGIRGMFVTGFHEARRLKNENCSGNVKIEASPVKAAPSPQKRKVLPVSRMAPATRPRTLIGQDSMDSCFSDVTTAMYDSAWEPFAMQNSLDAAIGLTDERDFCSLDDDVATCTMLSPDDYFEEVLELLVQDYHGKPYGNQTKRAADWDFDLAELKKCKVL